MFRRHAFRVSRTAYLASVGAVGTVVAETSEGGEQATPVETVEAPDLTASTEPDTVEREPPKAVFPKLAEKLSIYPSPTPTLVLLDTPSPLELQIGHVRRRVCGYYLDGRSQVQGVVDQWIRVEQSVESRLKSFHDPTEPLNPGLLYTGLSALTTSVVVRSRALPIRFLLPPLSFVGAFTYFLPRTAGRVGDWVEELEGTYAPRLGEIRRTAVAHTHMTVGMLGDKYGEGKRELGKHARSAVNGIEEHTGLRLSETLGWREKEGSDEDKS